VKDLLHGTWLAHPVHAVVTDVAIGAWTTAQVMDAAEFFGRRGTSTAATGAIAVGIGGAVASAASGLADWSDTHGEQRRVGLIHALLNIAGVTMYSASLLSRIGGHRSTGKLLSGAGFATVLASGYLGGDLAYRLGTQVDRNAWAGEIDDFEPAIRDAELTANEPVRVEVKGTPIMLVRVDGHIHAMNDVCSHAGCSLTEGRVEGDAIVCKCHGSTYRLQDGTVMHGPSAYSQPSYEVRVRKGQIEVRSALRIA
jgi:nitrite reductase/ring-hydroxylating ferredoxin subunit/uncharacterized membrane protein